jgi:hypothetical protein
VCLCPDLEFAGGTALKMLLLPVKKSHLYTPYKLLINIIKSRFIAPILLCPWQLQNYDSAMRISRINPQKNTA